jgi:hypothetical protein
MERDYLPIQPGNSPFYQIYRFIDQLFFFLLIFLVILLTSGLLWLKSVFFCCVRHSRVASHDWGPEIPPKKAGRIIACLLQNSRRFLDRLRKAASDKAAFLYVLSGV